MTPKDLSGLLVELGEPAFRAKQVCEWVFTHRVWRWEEMKNLPRALREKLAARVEVTLPEIVDRLEGEDASTKLLLSSRKGLIECVIMRYEGRTSLCVSSQVGCKFACKFCQTGRLGFVRDLDASEILAQFALADALVRPEGRKITHVVFMGMGEPLDNYEAVVAAVGQLISKESFGLKPAHVTVSTVGLPDKVRQLAVDAPCALAISLHAAREELRSELMPINRTAPLAALKEALLEHQKITGEKLTFEYILIRGKNASERDAKDLVRFLHGLRAKVNLIPFNPFPGLPYERPTEDEIRTFQKYLSDRKIPAPVRYSKGGEISAACGQLAAKREETLEERPRRERLFD
jgi:23S rRNA (adenine2503-C2)-methyltransferase